MNPIKEKITFFISGVLYLVFNLGRGETLTEILKNTFLHMLRTMPLVIGITIIIVAFLQYMANGRKMPWDRRLRIFFAIGIMTGLLYGIYEHAGVSIS